MKTRSQIISVFHPMFGVGILLALLMTSVGCDNANKPKDTKEMAEERNEDRFDTRRQEKDADFLVKAAEINLKEIQLGQLAQQRGGSDHVRELGRMMEEAHSKSQSDLIALAQRKAITIPTTLTVDGRDAYEKLNKKSAEDFDLEYADMMVKEHKDAIDKFEKASLDAGDADIRNWASNSLPELRTHLQHSEQCQERCKAEKKMK
jgi:putative membrane protein